VLSIEDGLRMAAATSSQPAAPSTGAPPAKPPAIPFFSSLIGRRATVSEITNSSHWTGVSRGRAQDEAAIAAAVREGFNVVLEIGPGKGRARHPVADVSCWAASFDGAREDWESIAEALGRLHAAGARIDWRAFDRSHPRSRVDVPASPRIRQSYWFAERPDARSTDAKATWDAVTRAAARQAQQVPLDLELSRFAELWAELDRFTTSSVARAVVELGLFTRAGSSQTVDGAMGEGHVLPMYRRLLALWFDRLVREGYLERRDGAFVANGKLASATAGHRGTPGPESDGVPVLRDYLVRCDRQMAAIVSGRQGPLETLFPAGSFETADFFYRHWCLARYYNGIMAAVAEALQKQSDGRLLRVLEIGGGTGGTTMSLLPVLNSGETEYWFTDVSETFFDRQDRGLADFPFVRYHRFDLDQDPAPQGLPLGQFDVVVAANALHAAKDLGKAIDRVRALLAPGGLLLLYEVTTHLDWFEMSIALIEGWQHHEDKLRAETPLLTPEHWLRALGEKGFDRVASYPPADSPAGVLGHNILVAAVPGIPGAVQTLAVTATAARRLDQAPAPGEKPAPAVGSAASSVRDRLSRLTQAEQRIELQQLVQRQVMRVMRLPASAPPPGVNDRLMNIGVDSLMAVELKANLVRELQGAVDLPSTLIFDHPTIAAIALHVQNALGYGSEPPRSGPQAVERPGRGSGEAEIAGMSDTEVEALLAERLREISK
jgi:SAM-dependent methyltransferase